MHREYFSAPESRRVAFEQKAELVAPRVYELPRTLVRTVPLYKDTTKPVVTTTDHPHRDAWGQLRLIGTFVSFALALGAGLGWALASTPFWTYAFGYAAVALAVGSVILILTHLMIEQAHDRAARRLRKAAQKS